MGSCHVVVHLATVSLIFVAPGSQEQLEWWVVGLPRSCSQFSESFQFLGDTLIMPECFVDLEKHQKDGHTGEQFILCARALDNCIAGEGTEAPKHGE